MLISRSRFGPVALSLALVSTACSGNDGPAKSLVKTPELEMAGQTKCSVARSQSRPLIVEWASSDRGALEALVRKGTVAVRFSGCEVEVLFACRPPGAYAYTAFTPKRDRVAITNADELYANLPVGAASLEGKLAQKGSLEVSLTLVGRYEASNGAVKASELQGECGLATHVITGITAGAFEFAAGGEAEVGAEAKALGAKMGGSSKASKETLSSDGSADACKAAKFDDKGPPADCGALLRIELAPIACFEGQKYVEGRGCVAGPEKPSEPSELDDPSQPTRLIKPGELEALAAKRVEVTKQPKGSPVWAQQVEALAKDSARAKQKAALERVVAQRDELEGDASAKERIAQFTAIEKQCADAEAQLRALIK